MTLTQTVQKPRRKRDQLLLGAREVFMAHGYAGASVDEIARVAGVSKATLYSYFADKAHLFNEMYRTELLRLADSAVEILAESVPPERALGEAARRIVDYVTSDFALAMFRICVSETPRFPEIGRAFFENGPELGRARLGKYLRAATARGALSIEDVDLAADQFLQLCQTRLIDQQLCGVQPHPPEDEMRKIANGAVEMFLARYASPEPHR